MLPANRHKGEQTMLNVKTVLVAGMILLAGSAAVLAQDTSSRGLARERLKEVGQDARRVTDENRTLSRHHTEVGRTFFDAHKYELAVVALKKAVELDPENKVAQDLLSRTESLLGVRRQQIRSVTEQLGVEMRIKIQESILELENHIQLASDYYNRADKPSAEDVSDKTRDAVLSKALHDLDIAREHVDRARDIIHWLPVDVDTSRQQSRVKGLSDAVTNLSNQKKAELASYAQLVAVREAEARRLRERDFEKQRISKLMDRAEMFAASQDFAKAMKTAREVLKLDPNHSGALSMVQNMRVKVTRSRDEKVAALNKEEKLNLNDQLTAATIPYARHLVYPDDWEDVRRRETVEMREADEPVWMKEIRRSLDKNVSFEFVETPLTEAVQFLQALTKVNIIFDPRALEQIGGDMPITLRVTDMPLHLALKWILRLANLDYTLKDEAVFISTSRYLAGEVELRVYDV
ncbi:MAG TPA: hypothetical protein ENN09_00960, partial [Planctomycetes bacterium]|nr:hypothetical protein [Planctomycetota bacterium]